MCDKLENNFQHNPLDRGGEQIEKTAVFVEDFDRIILNEKEF